MYQEDVIELYNKLGDVKAKIVSGIHGFDRQPINTDGDTILAWCFSQETGENLLNRIMYGGF